MAKAKIGDKVQVHYTGKLENGSVFDSSKVAGQPLELVIGDKEIIEGFSDAIVGMEPGDAKTVNIGPEKAYGPHLEDLVSDIPRKHVPPDIPLEVGQQLEISEKDEQGSIIVTITKVTQETLTVDANHPLSGKNLVFDLELVAIS